MAMVVSKIQVSYPGPSWPFCFNLKRETRKHDDDKRENTKVR